MSIQGKFRALKCGGRWVLAGVAIASLAIVPTACGPSSGNSTTTSTTTTKAGY